MKRRPRPTWVRDKNELVRIYAALALTENVHDPNKAGDEGKWNGDQ